ncbi:hypothetical protein [Arsenophonus endosymbiont of Aleurodicus floccissimus]|uniref:hypothetical protein n=1 Tax=Arsenophonus endosymbiont of Aleurodicus floccissimus TaxID=2152761 RepID=UPI001602EC31|nr:hypothetical protein [Arsenophonus endosymbiont of Aleurodicus floccissimus]
MTPTDFIVNTQTLVAIPFSQGMLNATAFVDRLEQSFLLAEKLEYCNEKPQSNNRPDAV